MRDISGRSLPLPSMRFDLESLSWRTCEATSLWDLEMSSPSFPEWGMTVSGELFELPTPERPTVAHVSSSLPTPLARDCHEMPIYRTDELVPNARDTLGRAIGNQLLPTPMAADGTKMSSNPETSARRMEKGNQASLTDIVQTEMLPPGYLLPTPVAHDGKEINIRVSKHRPDDQDSLARALYFLPTPVADNSRGLAQPGTDFSSLPNVAINLLSTPRARLEGNDVIKDRGHNFLEEQIASLLPTPRAQNGESRNQNIYARPLDQPQNLENALALLPTPTVMDMGSNYTPEEWEAWKLKQKEAHRNGNGHGASLTQEALSIGASIQGQFFDGSECSDDQPQIQLSPE